MNAPKGKRRRARNENIMRLYRRTDEIMVLLEGTVCTSPPAYELRVATISLKKFEGHELSAKSTLISFSSNTAHAYRLSHNFHVFIKCVTDCPTCMY